MKLKFICLILFVLICCKLKAVNITVKVVDGQQNPITFHQCYTQPFSIPTPTNNSIAIGGKIPATTDGTGAFTMTNPIVNCLWQVQVASPPQQQPFNLLLPLSLIGDSGTYNASLFLYPTQTNIFYPYIMVQNAANGYVPIATNTGNGYFWGPPGSIAPGTSFIGDPTQFGTNPVTGQVQITNGATTTNLAVAGILHAGILSNNLLNLNGSTIVAGNPAGSYPNGLLQIQGSTVFLGDNNSAVHSTTFNVVDQSSQIQANATLGYQLNGGLVTAQGGITAQSDSTFTGITGTHALLINPSTSDTAGTFEAAASGSADILTLAPHNGGTPYGGMTHAGLWYGAFPATNASSSVFGVVKVDGTTITSSGGVISAVSGGSASNITGVSPIVLTPGGGNAAVSLDTNSAVMLNYARTNQAGPIAAGLFIGGLSGNATTATTATSFSGSLSGDVTGTQSATVVSAIRSATIGNAQGLTNYQTGFLSPSQFGAVLDGTTDDTAAIQAAAYASAAQRLPVFFPSSNFVTGPIQMTNGTVFLLNRAHWIYASASTGFHIICTSTVTNVYVADGDFDGNMVGMGSLGGTVSWLFNANSNITINITQTRSCVQFGAQAPKVFFKGCTFRGYSDTIVQMYGTLGTFPQPTNNCAHFIDCSGQQSWIGLLATNNAEYVKIDGISFNNVGVAFWISSGNLTLNNLTANRCGAFSRIEGGGANTSNTKFVACNGNHNDYAIWATDVSNGVEFDNCNFIGAGGQSGGNLVCITNCNKIVLEGGKFGGTAIIVDGGSGSSSGLNEINPTTYNSHPLIATPNGGLLTIFRSAFDANTTSAAQIFTNSVSHVFSNASNQFTGTTYLNVSTNSGSNGIAGNLVVGGAATIAGSISNGIYHWTGSTGTGFVLQDTSGNGNLTMAAQTGGSGVDGWHTNGNTIGTSGSFLGTLDNTTLVFESGGIPSMTLSNSSTLGPNFIVGATSGGFANTIVRASTGNSILGGINNRMLGPSGQYCTIVGGGNNLIGNTFFSSTIGGGASNIIIGTAAFIAGGSSNVAGLNSFAGGYQAQALNNYCFVWNDGFNGASGTDGPFSSTANDQFLIHALGGVGINNNAPGTNAMAITGSTTNIGTHGVNGISVLNGPVTNVTTVTTIGNTTMSTSTNTGLLSIGGGLATSVLPKSANYTVASGDTVILATNGCTVVTMPDCTVNPGRIVSVLNLGTAAVIMTNSTGAQLFDYQWLAITNNVKGVQFTFQSDGTNWGVLSPDNTVSNYIGPNGNGGALTNLNASNITGGTTNGFTVIFTNLALNTVYTNTFSTPILVSGITPVFTTALVAGRCTMNFSITNSGVATNITPSQVTVGLIGSATGTMTNTSISFMLTNGGTFSITDASSGAGNSVSIAGNPSFSYVQQVAIANSFVGNGVGLTNVYAGAYKPQGGTPTIATNLPGLGGGGTAVIVNSGNDVPADNNANFILTSTASSTANAKVATITFGITLPQTPKRMILTFNGSSVTTEYQAMSLYATNLTTSGAEIWASAQALGAGAYHGNWDIKY